MLPNCCDFYLFSHLQRYERQRRDFLQFVSSPRYQRIGRRAELEGTYGWDSRKRYCWSAWQMPYLHGYFGYDESEFVPNKFLLYMHMVWRYPGARELSCFRWGCGTSSGQRYRQKFGNSRRNAEEALSKIKLQIVAEEFIPLEERQRREAFQRQPILFEDFALDEFLPWSTIQHSPSITPGKPPTGPPNPLLCGDAPARNHAQADRGLLTDTPSRWALPPRQADQDCQSRHHQPGVVRAKVLVRKAVEWGHAVRNPGQGD